MKTQFSDCTTGSQQGLLSLFNHMEKECWESVEQNGQELISDVLLMKVDFNDDKFENTYTSIRLECKRTAMETIRACLQEPTHCE